MLDRLVTLPVVVRKETGGWFEAELGGMFPESWERDKEAAQTC